MAIIKSHQTVINTVQQVVCGIGMARQIAQYCTALNISGVVMLVTDQGLAKLELHQPLIRDLESSGFKVVVYSGVSADPKEVILQEAAQLALNHQVSGVIGFGGGSSLDIAKMVALLGHDKSKDSLPDCYGVAQVKGERLPLIQIPTTAGTGSEVTPVAIITTGETTKSACVSPVLLADLVVLDASFMAKLPGAIAAATGVDAMVHALEAYTSAIKKNPISDGLAKQALFLLNENILDATGEKVELAAREQMLIGAMLAGQAFANAPVGAVHALAYPLGGHFHIPHGNSNGLVLVEVMKFNLPHAIDEYAQLAQQMLPDVTGWKPQKQAEALIEHFANLLQKLQLPLKLGDYGITGQDLPKLAEDAMQQTRLLQNNPRPVSYEDALNIYRALI